MSDLWDGLSQAFWLVVMLDPDLVEITLRSLRVTLTALAIASAIALPLAALLAVRRFRLRRPTIAVSDDRTGRGTRLNLLAKGAPAPTCLATLRRVERSGWNNPFFAHGATGSGAGCSATSNAR